jgi:nucleoside phosphorylase
MSFLVKVLAVSLLLFAKIAIASIDKILVLTPMPSEFAVFAEFDDQGSEVDVASQIKRFTVNGKHVVVATIGIGAVNAAMMSAFFIEKINPDLVIVSGVGGGLQKNIKIGDVVLASTVFSIHFGAYSGKGVFFQGGAPVNPVRNVQQPLIYNTAIGLIADNLKKNVHIGQVATTQNWPNNPDLVDLLVGNNVFAIDYGGCCS